MDLWKTICISLCSTDKLFQYSASSFSFQYLLLFLKLSKNFVLLLPIPFTLVIYLSILLWIRQFPLRICLVQLVLLCRILFRSVVFSSIHSRTSSLVTFSDHIIFSILLQYHSSKLSKYFHYNFLSVQVSEPNKLQKWHLTNFVLACL